MGTNATLPRVNMSAQRTHDDAPPVELRSRIPPSMREKDRIHAPPTPHHTVDRHPPDPPIDTHDVMRPGSTPLPPRADHGCMYRAHSGLCIEILVWAGLGWFGLLGWLCCFVVLWWG